MRVESDGEKHRQVIRLMQKRAESKKVQILNSKLKTYIEKWFRLFGIFLDWNKE